MMCVHDCFKGEGGYLACWQIVCVCVFSGVAYARYATPQCAAYARDKLNGFEYPIGSQLMVQLAEESAQPPGDPSHMNAP